MISRLTATGSLRSLGAAAVCLGGMLALPSCSVDRSGLCPESIDTDLRGCFEAAEGSVTIIQDRCNQLRGTGFELVRSGTWAFTGQVAAEGRAELTVGDGAADERLVLTWSDSPPSLVRASFRGGGADLTPCRGP